MAEPCASPVQAGYVVMMHNINDRLRLAIRGNYSFPVPTVADMTWEKVELSTSALSRDLWDFISFRSNILFGIRVQADSMNPFAGEPSNPALNEESIDFKDPHVETSLSQFTTNLEIFISVAKALHQIPVLMTQPLGRIRRIRQCSISRFVKYH